MNSTTGSESWYQLLMVVSTILSTAFYMGRKVEAMRAEIRLNRIDLAMLFKHFDLDQPSRALEDETQKARAKVLGII